MGYGVTAAMAVHEALRRHEVLELVDLRAFAREWDGGCLMRAPGCVFGPTCLGHLRVAGAGGTAIKPPDLCGLIVCDVCHSLLDARQSRVRGMSKQDVSVLAHQGMVRTMAAYAERGLVVVRVRGVS